MKYTGTTTNIGMSKINMSTTIPFSIVAQLMQEARQQSFSPELIQNVEFYPPAVKMTFRDGSVTTAVPQEGDEYDPKTGMMVCIMKYIWKTVNYNTALDKWIKKAEKEEQAKADAKAAKEQEKLQRQKAQEKAATKKARQREAQIEIQKEAYLRAMKEIHERAAE